MPSASPKKTRLVRWAGHSHVCRKSGGGRPLGDHVKTFRDLGRGDWHNDFPDSQPGEVPWDAFKWDDWKTFLEV